MILFQKSLRSTTQLLKIGGKNNIKDIHLIYVDQVLVIEGTASTVAPAATTEETAPVATETVEEAPAATTTYEAPAAPATPAAESNTAAASTVSGSEAEAKEWIAQKNQVVATLLQTDVTSDVTN